MANGRNRFGSRFDADDEPMAPLANLLDIMLVFACGLIAALAAQSGQLIDRQHAGGRPVEQGREVPELPERIGEAGSGYQPVGRVFRDPETGKLLLVDRAEDGSQR